MKKLLILVLLFSACSTTEDSPEQKWINSVYEQGWYQATGGSATDSPLRFQYDGSFIASITPFPSISDMPEQVTKLILDQVNEDGTYAYYRFTYKFNNENLTLYYGIFHGHLRSTEEPGIFWADKIFNTTPSLDASLSDKRAWLLKVFAKDNFTHSGYALALKKSSRSTTIENNIPNNSNDPTSDNASGTINN